MRWTTTVMSVLTGVLFVGLVVLGVFYVRHADGTNRSVSGAFVTPSASASPSATTVAPTPSATPSPATTIPSVPAHKLTVPPSRKPRPTSSPTPSPTPPPTLDFTLTTFNVLGASHTGGHGDEARRPSGRVRAAGAAALLARHRSDVVGFQELQVPQLAVLERRTDLTFYPGFSMRGPDTENSIGWRRTEWTAVEKHVVKIPYFAGGRRSMPVVRLRSNRTGLEAWFANFHNPAETHRFHHQGRFRLAATHIEAALANRLIESTGLPVFITGDMNERASYFCRLTAEAPMVAARGGTHNGRCLPGRPRAVDWIFGSQGVQFTDYTEDRSHLVDVTTDHPVVSARVRITGDSRNPGGALAPSSSPDG